MRCMSMACALAIVVAWAANAHANDWLMFGRDASRNAVSPEKNPPLRWNLDIKDNSGQVKQPAKGIKWQAKLGSNNLGGPVIADGLVWVGTNNQKPRDPKVKGDAAVLMCFRESD